ncbi:MAG: DUF501 domain-containing protein [Bifidobacteriaceae bacterium]|jgi:hypothetical protein|nr:DUF501 domain-containing protein [Bifidobacteriaceae bacterium]
MTRPMPSAFPHSPLAERPGPAGPPAPGPQPAGAARPEAAHRLRLGDWLAPDAGLLRVDAAGRRPAPAVPQADRSRPEASPQDLALIAVHLGREPRGLSGIAARCVCGAPLVTRTAPRLPSGEPFPTTFYLTHPAAAKAIGRLESAGWMAAMSHRLAGDAGLAAAYRAAHLDYLARRAQLGEPPEIAGISAGGMPDRVKCLHALAAHALAAGPGVNPLGDETLLEIAPAWRPDRCACPPPGAAPAADAEASPSPRPMPPAPPGPPAAHAAAAQPGHAAPPRARPAAPSEARPAAARGQAASGG